MRHALPLAGATLVALLLGVGLAAVAPGRPAGGAAADLGSLVAAEAAPGAAPGSLAPAAEAPVGAVAAAADRERLAELPVERWSERLRALVATRAWPQLRGELAALERAAPRAYAQHRLGYLHGRAALYAGAPREARQRLLPFVSAAGAFEPLALYHLAAAARDDGQAAEAARLRRELLLGHPGSFYWPEALAEHLAWLQGDGDPAATLGFLEAVLPVAARDERVRRDLQARRVTALAALGRAAEARREGLALLLRSPADDAAERVATLLDDPAVLPHLAPAELRRLADSMHLHRRWGRAVELLQLAREQLPRDRAEIDFAIGRAHFFAEDYAAAREAYLRAAPLATRPGERARCLYHAARAAQLLGDDAEAEALLTRAISVPGRFEATTAALTGRLRLRVGRGDLAAAHQDLTLLRRLFPRDAALVDGAVAFAMGEIAAGRPADALQTLGGLPGSLNPHQRAEVGYWRGRALEATAPERALAVYLEVLRADVPTHFAYLARHRLEGERLAAAASATAGRRSAEARRLLRAGDAEAARRLQTDAVLLGASGEADLAFLATIYRELPAYRRVLELQPLPLPALPLADNPSAGQLLAALGLYDEAAPAVPALFPLSPMRSGLTRSLAFRLGNASRPSIQAAESLAEQVPDDYVPQLLPPLFRELLYPRYFWESIETEARRNGADPRLLVAIMREESRFNPRAKSPAAARGLMQILLGTARQVAVGLELLEVAAEDLYDPHLVIKLGAKYVGDLLVVLDGDPYATAAAYNAGPNQAQLWQRLAPAPGPDFFLSTVSFSETKHYVRKVLNSYERYGEIYQGEPPVGGTRAEP